MYVNPTGVRPGRCGARTRGAQIITTDYYRADTRINAAYAIHFGDGKYARLNPVTAGPPSPVPAQ